MMLKWLVAIVAFVVKRSGVGCCGDFHCGVMMSVVRVRGEVSFGE